MLFHTWTFAIFFALVYAVYLAIRRTRLVDYWLLAASYLFYGWWNPLYLLLIAFTSTLDFCIGLLLARGRHRKLLVAVSMLINLSYLGFFKYAGFLIANLNLLLAQTRLAYRLPEPDILLPVGVSFFIFQSLSYVIDLYRGRVPVERSLVRYATFVSFFPQLVAGPIERGRNLLIQFYQPRTISRREVTDGLSIFLVGLFKKVAIADGLAAYVDQVYAAPDQFGGATLLLATFAFAWQIYCDFSGYTDMARGVARLMGFELMLNFNNPYLAADLGDFWNRWHISLSSWFKDYVYIPMGGSRQGLWRTYRNMFLTMLISGLWHGAAWTFVVWGALHGLGRVCTRELDRSPIIRDRVPRLVRQGLVFAFVLLTWVFFRARSLADALTILNRIVETPFAWPRFPPLALALCLGLWAGQFLYESRHRRLLESTPVRVALAAGMLLYLLFFTAGGNTQFIYFQF